MPFLFLVILLAPLALKVAEGLGALVRVQDDRVRLWSPRKVPKERPDQVLRIGTWFQSGTVRRIGIYSNWALKDQRAF